MEGRDRSDHPRHPKGGRGGQITTHLLPKFPNMQSLGNVINVVVNMCCRDRCWGRLGRWSRSSRIKGRSSCSKSERRRESSRSECFIEETGAMSVGVGVSVGVKVSVGIRVRV